MKTRTIEVESTAGMKAGDLVRLGDGEIVKVERVESPTIFICYPRG
jgi:hypothetical protein